MGGRKIRWELNKMLIMFINLMKKPEAINCD